MGRNRINIKTSLSDFLSYFENRLSSQERNSFEKELQRDPFAQEAAEGFELISPGEAGKDIEMLKRRLSKRTAAKNTRLIYRIAASVAVLMLISTIVFMVWRSQYIRTGTAEKDPSGELLITLADPIKREAGRNIISEEPGLQEKEKEPAEVIRPETAAGGNMALARSETGTVVKPVDSVTVRDLAAIPEAIAEAEIPAVRSRAPAMAKAAVQTNREIRGKVISSEDDLPLPGASIVLKGTTIGAVSDMSGNFRITLPDTDRRTLVAAYIGMETKEIRATTDSLMEVKLDPSVSALDEVVVVGYGVAKKAGIAGDKAMAVSERNEQQYEFVSPEPVSGKQQFTDYIEKNIRKPEEMQDNSRLVVVLGFTVRTDGSLYNMSIIRSPGEEYSAEAMRLIREGPAWRPARENGIPVEEDVRIRIVFR